MNTRVERADSKKELEFKIKQIYEGNYSGKGDLEETYLDIISNMKGEIEVELYR